MIPQIFLENDIAFTDKYKFKFKEINGMRVFRNQEMRLFLTMISTDPNNPWEEDIYPDEITWTEPRQLLASLSKQIKEVLTKHNDTTNDTNGKI